MPQPGGTIYCGGAVRCAKNAKDTFRYLEVTNSGTTPDDVLGVLGKGMTETEEYA